MPQPRKRLSHEIKEVFRLLEQTHPLTMLEQFSHYPKFQLLVMTLLSARAKDSTTIPIVVEMFKQYPLPQDYTIMSPEQLEKIIYKIGFYRTKARQVIALSKILLEKYEGKVPETFEELTSLPGVGRKTANCMIAYAFHQPAIAVDVHVHRISNRLGWVRTKTPEETELQLQNIIPQEDWRNVNRLFVGHGQSICLPRNPQCPRCPIWRYCELGRERVDKNQQKSSELMPLTSKSYILQQETTRRSK